MKTSFKRASGVWLMVLAGAVALMATVPGCLVTSHKHETHSGNEVSQATFDQIEPGVTTKEWVRATLGEPTSKNGGDADQVWKYVYTTRTDSSGSVFLIFGGSDVKKTKHEAVVEMRDGLVVKKWRN